MVWTWVCPKTAGAIIEDVGREALKRCWINLDGHAYFLEIFLALLCLAKRFFISCGDSEETQNYFMHAKSSNFAYTGRAPTFCLPFLVRLVDSQCGPVFVPESNPEILKACSSLLEFLSAFSSSKNGERLARSNSWARKAMWRLEFGLTAWDSKIGS